VDSLTHMVLGAALGEATLGRRVGAKAMAWGAMAATVPDLDVLLRAFLPEVEALTLHRTYSHSLLFAVVAAMALGWAASRLHARTAVPWRAWTGMLGAALLSHIALDLFTVEGVHLFLPFHAEPVAFATISLVDPVYTVPLLVAVLGAVLWRRAAGARRVFAIAGLGLSTLYLGMTVVNKVHMEQHFQAQLEHQEISYERLLVQPTLFNNVLWRAIAQTDEGYYVGFRSHLDGTGGVRWRFIPRHEDKLSAIEADPSVDRLRRLTRNWYVVARDGDGLIVTDMRYGNALEWRDDEGEPWFAFRLRQPGDGVVIERIPCGSDLGDYGERLQALFVRMLGI